MDWQRIALHSLADFTTEPPTVLAMYLKVWGKASVYVFIFVGAWAFIAVCMASKNLFPENRGTWALKCAMLLHHGLICPLAVIGLMQDPAVRAMYGCFGCESSAMAMNRDPAGPSVAAQALAPITIGYFIGDLLLLPNWNLTKSGAVENGLMLIHHVASILVWPAAVYFDWVARYVLIMLSYEFTSFFLTVIWMLQQLDMKSGSLYKVVGLVFTASFVLMRWFGAVPQLIAMWNSPPWSEAVERAASPKGVHHLCWIFSASLLLPHVMNFFWGVKVVKGFLAVVLKTKPKEIAKTQ